MILPLYYLADATLTLLRRIKNREPFWQAHRTHYYQLAIDRGYSVPEIVARVFIVNVALVALAVVSVQQRAAAGLDRVDPGRRADRAHAHPGVRDEDRHQPRPYVDNLMLEVPGSTASTDEMVARTERDCC